MVKHISAAALLFAFSGLLAPPASAEITSVSAAGPGGTVSSLAIEPTFYGDNTACSI